MTSSTGSDTTGEATRRIGVFGGTFDPPHIGHCVVAQELHYQLDLDHLFVVPAAVPPHKRSMPLTAAALRAEMLLAAFGDDRRFTVCDIEIRRPGESYTVDTLRDLRAREPEAKIFLGVGADQLAEFDSWRDTEGIVELATVVGFARAGETALGPGGWAERVVEVPAIEVSSTDIRERVRRGVPIKFLVPKSVEDVIRREGLYRGC